MCSLTIESDTPKVPDHIPTPPKTLILERRKKLPKQSQKREPDSGTREERA